MSLSNDVCASLRVKTPSHRDDIDQQRAALFGELPSIAPFNVVQARIGISRSALFEAIRRGNFPKPISLTPSGKRKGFLVSEVEQWIEERKQERS